jgi:MtN3 and saliva related transmembrane protein
MYVQIHDPIMPPDPDTLIGYAAAVLTTAAFVPQAWKSWRSRDLRGISLPMYALFTLGVALWCAYGVVIGSAPVVAANGITLVLASVVLALKLRE